MFKFWSSFLFKLFYVLFFLPLLHSCSCKAALAAVQLACPSTQLVQRTRRPGTYDTGKKLHMDARTVIQLVNPNVKGANRRKIWKIEILE